MKRLIVLLIVLAGGLAAAAFAIPSNAATVNGAAISQDDVNTDLSAIANSPDYQCFLNAEELVGTQGQTGLPPVDGVGRPTGTDEHPTASAAFASNYVDTLIGHQLVLELADKDGLQVTSQDLATARTQLETQITATLQDVAGSTYACGTGDVGPHRSRRPAHHAELVRRPNRPLRRDGGAVRGTPGRRGPDDG